VTVVEVKIGSKEMFNDKVTKNVVYQSTKKMTMKAKLK
jgi:hypothetical protein